MSRCADQAVTTCTKRNAPRGARLIARRVSCVNYIFLTSACEEGCGTSCLVEHMSTRYFAFFFNHPCCRTFRSPVEVLRKSFGYLDFRAPILKSMPENFWAVAGVPSLFKGRYMLPGVLENLRVFWSGILFVSAAHTCWATSRVRNARSNDASLEFLLSDTQSFIIIYHALLSEVVVRLAQDTSS